MKKDNEMATAIKKRNNSPAVDAACSIARRAMTQWPGYRPTDKIKVHEFLEGQIFLGYNVTETNHDGYWTANIVDDVFYLLSIRLPQSMRGKGLGSQLYEIITDIAKELGCREIRQTPSGQTATGESRTRYLIRRGWWCDGREVMKRLIR